MLIKILGSAAGGGFPQWNCACLNCSSLRAGTFRGKARTQAQVAISSAGRSWFLLGACPDLRAQIEVTPELHPRAGLRQSPISGAVLLNADVDHVLGLLLLRELQPLCAYTTKSIRRILTEDNSLFAMLQRVPNQLTWTDFAAGTGFRLHHAGGPESPLRCQAVALGNHFPAYVSQSRRKQLCEEEASLGLIVESPSGKRLAYMPAVPQITGDLLRQLDAADLVFFDGTFWNDEELIRIQGSGQTARQMGHVAVAASLVQLAQLTRPRKIYIHINNSNPMLNEAGREYRQVRDAGWEIAEDGWQFEL